MFSATDNDKLRQIMNKDPEIKALFTKLLESHKLEISTISHEIRNPLTLVYSTLQLIEAQHPEVFSFRHWDTMHQDIEYMNQLLEELSIYNNGERLNLSVIDTAAFLKKLALSFASSLLDTNIEFTSRIVPELPPISIDAIKIRQMLLNILRNAKDAVLSCSDSIHPSITLTTKYIHDKIYISIADNGCGIASRELPSIFEPFNTNKDGGTGLGLAIAKRIITAHRGSIHVESTLGEGSDFTVMLPVQ